jgi:hypothetical protein
MLNRLPTRTRAGALTCVRVGWMTSGVNEPEFDAAST